MGAPGRTGRRKHTLRLRRFGALLAASAALSDAVLCFQAPSLLLWGLQTGPLGGSYKRGPESGPGDARAYTQGLRLGERRQGQGLGSGELSLVPRPCRGGQRSPGAGGGGGG